MRLRQQPSDQRENMENYKEKGWYFPLNDNEFSKCETCVLSKILTSGSSSSVTINLLISFDTENVWSCASTRAIQNMIM